MEIWLLFLLLWFPPIKPPRLLKEEATNPRLDQRRKASPGWNLEWGSWAYTRVKVGEPPRQSGLANSAFVILHPFTE